jgi:hypothetical protein
MRTRASYRARMHCAACGAGVELASGERVGFRDECPRCRADLHSCRNCAHHDVGAYNECREPGTERVADRERANRCDWFAPRAGAPPAAGAGGDAKAALDALFRPRKA